MVVASDVGVSFLNIILFFFLFIVVSCVGGTLWIVPHGKVLVKKILQRFLIFRKQKKNYALARIYGLDSNPSYITIDLNKTHFSVSNHLYEIMRGAIKREFLGVSVLEYNIDCTEPINNTLYRQNRKVLEYQLNADGEIALDEKQKPIIIEVEKEVSIPFKVIKYSPEQIDALVSRIIDSAMAQALREKQKKQGGLLFWILITTLLIGVVLFFQNNAQNNLIQSVADVCSKNLQYLNQSSIVTGIKVV